MSKRNLSSVIGRRTRKAKESFLVSKKPFLCEKYAKRTFPYDPKEPFLFPERTFPFQVFAKKNLSFCKKKNLSFFQNASKKNLSFLQKEPFLLTKKNLSFYKKEPFLFGKRTFPYDPKEPFLVNQTHQPLFELFR